MNLNDLKKHVPAVIYKRGLDYFERDFVKQLTQDAPNRWSALVAGSRYYDVTVKLSDAGAILSSFCTCPFKSDSLCKHEVAVCLAIREYKEENVSAVVDVVPRLKELKKAELLEILEDLAQRQPAVNLYLVDRFLNPAGMDEEIARRIIRQSVGRASSGHLIEWNRTDQALEGTWKVQEYIDTLEMEQHGEKIIRLSLVVIEECSEILQMADDSFGTIGSAISESLEKIDETMVVWPAELDESAVDEMLELLYPHILFSLAQDIADAAGELMESLMYWNERGDFAEKFLRFLERIIDSREMQNKRYDYETEHFRLLQLEILQQQGDWEAVEGFYSKHQEFPKIRKVRVRAALHKEEFEKAVRLCKESEQMDSDFPGLVQDWRKLRFEAYEGMGSTAEMIELAHAFALDGDEFYYRKLKQLVEPERWPETVNDLLEDLKEGARGNSLYVQILIDEKRSEKLLEYCRANVYAIENLHPYLLADYPHEVNELYTSYIYRLIEPASDRKAYRNACEKIKSFQKALGVEPAAGLIEELKFMYPRRKALLDELSKI